MKLFLAWSWVKSWELLFRKELVKMNVCSMLSLLPPVVAWVPNPLLKVIHSTFIPAGTSVSWLSGREHTAVWEGQLVCVGVLPVWIRLLLPGFCLEHSVPHQVHLQWQESRLCIVKDLLLLYGPCLWWAKNNSQLTDKAGKSLGSGVPVKSKGPFPFHLETCAMGARATPFCRTSLMSK